MVSVPEEYARAAALLSPKKRRSSPRAGAAACDAAARHHGRGAGGGDRAGAFSDAAFFSIGSNDLTQYVMAAARDNASVAGAEFECRNPAVLRLIGSVAAFGRRHDIPVSLCGDAGGDPAAIPHLLQARACATSPSRRRNWRWPRRRSPASTVLAMAMKAATAAPRRRGRDPRLQDHPVDGHRTAPFGHAPAACRRARQAPQLHHPDHQPGLSDADPGEASAGDLFRLPLQPAGARRIPRCLPHRRIRARRRLPAGCARTRHMSLTVPDLGDDKQNAALDRAINEFIHRITSIAGKGIVGD